MGSCCCTRFWRNSDNATRSRTPYIVVFIVFALVGFILSVGADKSVREFPFYKESWCDELCARNGAVYRVGCCLSIFYGVHLIILSIPGTGSFHTFCNPVKFILLLVGFISSFWWSNSAMEAYADWARWLSWLFLILQSFLLINWAYDTHEEMMLKIFGSNGEDGETAQKYVYIILCLVLATGAYVLIGFFFHEYGASGCGASQAFLVVTIVFGVIEMCMSFIIVHGNGFVASVVMLYVTYLTFQALATTSDASCYSPEWSEKAPSYTGLSILIITLSYVGYDKRMLKQEDRELVSTEETNEGEPTDDVKVYHALIQKMNRFFHLVMTMGSFYLTMLMTNWGAGSGSTEWYREPATPWINVSAEWIAMIMYIWVLLAPSLFPDYEFAFASPAMT